VLTHGYLGLDLEAVWSVVDQDLPMLEKAIATMKAGLDAGTEE
jgi:uncharacterized protein with HEPN domain